MATHSRIIAWRTPWTEGPGGLQSTGSQRDRHDLATEQQVKAFDTCIPGEESTSAPRTILFMGYVYHSVLYP